MIGPRDHPPSGQSLVTDNQKHHLDAIMAAGDALYTAMHDAEGSGPPGVNESEHHFQTRRMAIAASNLETALMYARKAVME
jgi:hypothetical protein